MTFTHLAAVSPDRPPLDPTAAQARAQLAHELGTSPYTHAQPSPLEQIAQDLTNWFNSLFTIQGAGGLDLTGLLDTIIVVVIVAVLVVGFLVFGLPRINRRSSVTGSLFGDEDDRDSTALRRAAERAAASGDYTTAIEEGFRAIARDLTERVILTTFPGTTAHSFAQQAGRAFPSFAGALASAADVFDAVRYLGSDATESDWLAVSALGQSLASARPVLDPVDA